MACIRWTNVLKYVCLLFGSFSNSGTKSKQDISTLYRRVRKANSVASSVTWDSVRAVSLEHGIKDALFISIFGLRLPLLILSRLFLESSLKYRSHLAKHASIVWAP